MEIHQKPLIKRGYTILENIGEGGQYYVYLASHKSHGLCAIRAFYKPVQSLEQLPRAVRDELKLAVRFGHNPNFVTLFNYFVEDNLLFTVWNYAEDGTLRNKVCQKNPPNQKECLLYLTRVAKGLDQLHQEGGCHGDIKPENLLLPDPEFAIIGDLGLARLNESLTIRKTAMGTEAYCLPGNTLSAPTRERDIFGFAVTFAELRLGRHPYGSGDEEIVRNLRSNSPDLKGLSKHEFEKLTAVLVPNPKIDSVYEWLLEISNDPKLNEATTERLINKLLHVCSGLEAQLKLRNRVQDNSQKPLTLGPLVKNETALKTMKREIFTAIRIRNRIVHHTIDHGCSDIQIQSAIQTFMQATSLLKVSKNQSPSRPVTSSNNEQEKKSGKGIQPSGNSAHDNQTQQTTPNEYESHRASASFPKWMQKKLTASRTAEERECGALLESELTETKRASIPVLFFAYGLSPEQILKVMNLTDTLRENMECFLLSICRESIGKSLEEKWNNRRRELLKAAFPDWIKSYVPAPRIPGVETKTIKEIECHFFELNESPGRIRRALNLPSNLTTRIGDYLSHLVTESKDRTGEPESKWGQAKGEYLMRLTLSGGTINDSFISNYCGVNLTSQPEAVSVESKPKVESKPQDNPNSAHPKGSKKKKNKRNKKQFIDTSISLESALCTWPQKKWKTKGLSKLTNSEKERLKKILLSSSHPETVKSFCQAAEINENKALSVLSYAYQFILSQGGKGLTFNERLTYCKSPRSDQVENEPQAHAKTPVSLQSSPYPYKSQKGNRKKSRSVHQRLRASYTLAFTSQQKMTIRVAFLSITESLDWPAEELVFNKTHQLAKSYPHLFNAIPQKHTALIGPYVNSYLKAKGWQKSNSSAWNSAVTETQQTIAAKQGIKRQQTEEIMQSILTWEQLVNSKTQDAHVGTESEELASGRKTESKSFSDWPWPSTVGFSFLAVTLLSWLLMPKTLTIATSSGHFHLSDCMLVLGFISLMLELRRKPKEIPVWPLLRKWQSPFSAGFMLLIYAQFTISGLSIAAQFQKYQLHKISILILSAFLVTSLSFLFGLNSSRHLGNDSKSSRDH